ncbi:hypothetical protein D1007_29444 [Hordeum vulgare]|nr:hypothetical protein D1007_29444 [Hordeum vulgare]
MASTSESPAILSPESRPLSPPAWSTHNILMRAEVFDLRADAYGGDPFWWALKCSSAYAVDKSDEDLAKSIVLLARVVPPTLSALGIYFKPKDAVPFRPDPIAFIEAMDDDGVIVLAEQFQDGEESNRLIVYDSIRRSLVVVPRLSSWYCTPRLTAQPFVVRSRDGCYALAVMVSCHIYDRKLQQETGMDALCLWPPPPRSKPHPQGSIRPWQLKQPVFPLDKPDHLWAHVTFSFQGKAFWIDLGEGVLFCEADDVLFGDYEVQFHYVPLPTECLFAQNCLNKGRTDLKWSRAISYCEADNSIKLVCIGKGCECKECGGPQPAGDLVVSSWALDVATWHWCSEDGGGNGFRVASLWDMSNFKKLGLPQVAPIFPLLSMQEDGDNVLSFNLHDSISEYVHLCYLNLRTKVVITSDFVSRSPTEQSVFASRFFKDMKNKDMFDLANPNDQPFPIPPKRGLNCSEEGEDMPPLVPVNKKAPGKY